ncbi:MAG: SBBP repeat-containing protein, partial [Bryobacterales bacterium]|nr:SBBP repeat-containing protein [Bryobacterales bacterium]
MRIAILFTIIPTLAAAGPWFEPAAGGFSSRGARYTARIGGSGFETTAPGRQWSARFLSQTSGICAGDHQRPSRSNYMLGKQSSEWRLWVPQYDRVRCRGTYPGIEIVYSFNPEGLLEFDLEVAPHADPSQVRIETSRAPDWRLREPQAWQTIAGKRRMVPAALRRAGDGALAYKLGPYDHTLPLLIDPVVDYATYLGATGGASGETIAIDKHGNIYVAGTVTSNTFPTSDQAMQPLFAGSNDIFVSKFDPTGSTLLYSTYLGSYLDDR